MTFKQEIEKAADGESIEGIVIGGFGSSWGDEKDEDAYAWGRNPRKPIPQELKNKVFAWDEVSEYLNYNYDRGYGSEECHSITAWTKSYVIAVGCYDGSTWVYSVPRNPVDHVPTMQGGG